MKKKLFLAILTMAMAFSLVFGCGMTAFAAMTGTGESGTPYLVSNVADLNEIQSAINAEEKGGAHAKAFYKISADISGADGLTASIGTEDKPFMGAFDGDGKTISGLKKPLFGYMERDAAVQNMTLKDCAIDSSDLDNVGALAAKAANSKIQGVLVMGKVTASKSGANVGALVGYADTCTMRGINSNATITASAENSNAGGVVGASSKGTLNESYNVGTVKAGGNVGGLIGVAKGTDLDGGFNYGTLTGSTKGGIVGDVDGGTYKDLYFLSVSGLKYAGKEANVTSPAVTGKTAAQFRGGEVAYLLQGTEADLVWGQTVSGNSVDKYPTFTTSDTKRVLKATLMEGKTTLDAEYFNYNAAPTFRGIGKSGYAVEAYTDEAMTKEVTDKDVFTKDTTFYVKYVPSVTAYTVTFNSNGGSSVASLKVDSGKTITKPKDPTKSGYTFNGWYKESGLTNAWDFAKDTVTADTTLYAKWTANAAAAATKNATNNDGNTNVKTGDEGTPVVLYILLAIAVLGAAIAGGILLYRHFKFY